MEDTECTSQFIFEEVLDLEIPTTVRGYRLPVRTSEGPRFSQGYCGPYSHKAIRRIPTATRGVIILHDDRFSLDFAVPVGTPVFPARPGIVYITCDEIDTFYEGTDPAQGILMPPNLITIQHFDGTHTLYSHFGHGQVRVKSGDIVNLETILGTSGKSGWMGGIPHVHFSALRLDTRYNRRTFPVEFVDYKGPVYHDELKRAELLVVSR